MAKIRATDGIPRPLMREEMEPPTSSEISGFEYLKERGESGVSNELLRFVDSTMASSS